MRKLLTAGLLTFSTLLFSQGTSTRPAVVANINSNIFPNTSNYISPAIMNGVLKNIANNYFNSNTDTLKVPAGGTGKKSFTPYSVICAGTTSVSAFQNVSGLGTSGQVLTSSGAGALPTWTTPASGSVTSVLGVAPIISSGGAT